MELVVAQVERGVDGAEGLEGVGHLLLLALLVQTRAAVNDQTVWRHLGEPRHESQRLRVQLQLLLGGRDGAQHGQSVHTRFDVGGGSVFTNQHVRGVRDLASERRTESTT